MKTFQTKALYVTRYSEAEKKLNNGSENEKNITPVTYKTLTLETIMKRLIIFASIITFAAAYAAYRWWKSRHPPDDGGSYHNFSSLRPLTCI